MSDSKNKTGIGDYKPSTPAERKERREEREKNPPNPDIVERFEKALTGPIEEVLPPTVHPPDEKPD